MCNAGNVKSVVGVKNFCVQHQPLNEEYVSRCDDVDFSLPVRSLGLGLYVIRAAALPHFAGKSRYLKGASSKIHGAQPRLVSKWGNDLSVYNDLSYFVRRGAVSPVSAGEA